MKPNRFAMLLVILFCLTIFVIGLMFILRLAFPGKSGGGISPTLAAIMTSDAQEDAIATRVAEALGQSADVSATYLPTMQPTGLPTSVSVDYLVTPETVQDGLHTYTTRSGDTVAALGLRFGIENAEIIAGGASSPTGYLPIGQLIRVPPYLGATTLPTLLLPDAAIVYGPLDAGFDVAAYVADAGGYLSHYSENVRGTVMSGADIVKRVALEHSISAKLLLAILEYRSGWVNADTTAMDGQQYPLGYGIADAAGLYEELYITGRQLGYGYYGWRDGSRTKIRFADGSEVRLHPEINAGTAAIENLFASLDSPTAWNLHLFGENSFGAVYAQMFGIPWEQSTSPLIPDGLVQPVLELPFGVGEDYHLTSGPHRAWGLGSPWAAIDFAPADGLKGCTVSPFWVTAAAAGLVVRSANGVVVIDLDGDGYEQTGWALFYLHLADKDRVQAGEWVEQDQKIGHASCTGGVATGSHVHFARKYNGEWMHAAGEIPLLLSGWQVLNGEAEYQGKLMRDGLMVSSYRYSITESKISRD